MPLTITTAWAQIQKLNLEKVVEMAKIQSPEAIGSKHKYRGSYWQFRSFKANYLPNLTLDATIPTLDRSISTVTLANGNDVFIKRSQAKSLANLSLTQNISPTGGQIFITSGLQRLDLIGDSNSFSYASTPISIGLRQPVFGFNQYKWERRIEPLKYAEAEKQYLMDMEDISFKATNYYFDLLFAQININVSEVNLANNDTLFKIAMGRYDLGKIAENELLQMELSLLNSKAQAEQSKIDYEANLFRLKSYLGIKDNSKLELLLPTAVRSLQIPVEKAIVQAKVNRPESVEYERKIIEAKRDVNKAKAENRFNANLYAVYGLSQSAADLNNAYGNPIDGQSVSFGVQVPILNWGLSKAKIKMAQSNQELAKVTIDQQMNDFDQEVFLKVAEFNLLKQQLYIAAKADTIAIKRYFVTKQRYLIGKIDITELNIAQSEKDQAKQSYILALRKYWTSYYNIRKLTLYDFESDKLLEIDFKALK